MIKKATAYARISTDKDDQENSLKNQKEYWEGYIKSQPNLKYIGLFWDEGFSGTSIRKREGFKRMIADAFAGKIDVIYVKNISRFSRNTLDLLKYTRELRDIGVAVIFEKEGINTMELSGEILMTIFSSIAQEESRNISENVRFGHRQAMTSGIVYGNGNILGYDIVDKKLVINKKESELVKTIFNWFVNEKESYRGIVRRLKDLGAERGKSGGLIQTATIKNILQNEKYCGDLKQQKYYSPDFLNRTQKKNKGEKDFYIIENNHEAIIDKDTWKKAQSIINEKKDNYTQSIGFSKSCWGGKIFCGYCEDKFRSRTITTTKTKFKVWLCNTNYNKGKKECDNGSYLREDLIEKIFMDVLSNISTKQEDIEFLNDYYNILNSVLKNGEDKDRIKILNSQLSKIINKKDRLMELYEDSQLNKDDFDRRYEMLNKEEIGIRQEINEIKNREMVIKDRVSKIKSLMDGLKNITSLTEFNRKYVDEFLERIIKNGNKLKIILTIGYEKEVDISDYPKGKHTKHGFSPGDFFMGYHGPG